MATKKLSSISNTLLTNTKADSRIRSIVAISPELTKVLDTKSLENIQTNVSIVSLSAQVKPALEPADAIANIPNLNWSNIESAAAFSAFSICTSKGKKILSLEGDDEICKEYTQHSRQENHQKILTKILDSLSVVTKDN